MFFAPIECSRGTTDDECGCRRSMAGLVSQRERRRERWPNGRIWIRHLLHTYRGRPPEQGYVTEVLMKKRNVSYWEHDLTDELDRTPPAAAW